MRLIDGDALKDRLQSLAYDDWNQGVSTSWADAYRECADMVEEMPTIEPERKRGKWIAAKYPFSKCSICECYFDTANNIGNFCPNCGSDMRGKQHEID